MFKQNPISPISKDKWVSNNNNYHSTNQQYLPYNHSVNFYQNGNTNPLSPINKNPVSPSVKMFGNNLNYKKNKQNMQDKSLHNNFQMLEKNQNMEIRNLIDMNQNQFNTAYQAQNNHNKLNHALNFINLQCDQVLQNVTKNIGNTYTPKHNENKSFYELNKKQTKQRQKATSAVDFKNQINKQKKFSINLPEQIDLICDETLEIKDRQKDQKKQMKRYNPPITDIQQYKKSPISYKRTSNHQEKVQLNKIQDDYDNTQNKVNIQKHTYIRMQKLLQKYKTALENQAGEKQYYKKEVIVLRKLLDQK